MTLKDFEQQIDPVILERGRQYFDSGAVLSLEKESGNWVAIVEGSEAYEVIVEGTRKFNDWECACPYEYGSVCKHVAATLFAIREAIERTKNKRGKSKKSGLDLVFEKVPPEELLAFFRKQLRYHRELKNKLMIEFADRLAEKNSEGYYQELLQKIIAGLSDNYGFIHDSRKLSRSVEKLIGNAENAFAGKNYEDTLAICRTIISYLPEVFQYADDSGGYLYDCYQRAFELIEHLLVDFSAIDFRPRVFDFLLEEATEKKYEDLELDHNFLDLLLQYHPPSAFARIEALLLSKLEASKFEPYGEYSQSYLIDLLIDLYQKNDHYEQAEALQSEYLHLPRIRESKVEYLLEEKDYEAAKEMVLEGIRIARERNHPGTVDSWRQWLIEIARLEGDKEMQLQLMEQYYLQQRGHDEEAFRDLKNAWPAETWPDKRAELIEQIKKRKSSLGYPDYYQLAYIFQEESMYTDLLALLQDQKEHHYFVKQFYQDVLTGFPAETLGLLEPAILSMASEMGRPKYKELARFLKGLRKAKGGKTFVSRFVKQFRRQYANRPAMMEELSIF